MNFSRLLRLLSLCTLLSFPIYVNAVDFQEGWHLEEGANSAAVELVDIDQDGDLDAYITESGSADRLWINDGQGVFSLSPQLLDTTYGLGAAFGLLDAGAYPDLFLSRLSSPSSVWLNDGAGTLADSNQTLGSGQNSSHVELGFLDNVAGLDAFQLANGASNKVFFNDGAGVFTDSGQALELGNNQSLDVVLIDVGEDANGDIDAVIANNGFNRVWYNDGNGVFTDSGESLNSTSSFGVAVDYLNNDAILDVFFANGNNSGAGNTIFFGDGDGTFTQDSQSLGDNYSVSVAVFDFDGQNGPDAFVGNNSGEMDRLWLNDGSGNFTDSGQTLGMGAAFGSDIGLINNDAHMDVILANRYQPNQIWLGDGAGGFTNSGQALGSFQAQGMAIADIDGDNDLDGVFGAVGGTARVFVNDGAGNFTDTNQWLATGLGNNASEIALADLDGVNGVDIYIGVSPQGGAGNYADRVFFNNGSGVFSDSGQTLGGENTGAVAIGDVDGDDEPDVFVGNAPYNADTGENRLWLNSGGTLSQSAQNFGDGNTRAAALIDLDNDDDLDIFIGNTGSQGSRANRIYLNGEGNGDTDPEGVFIDSGQSLGDSKTFDVTFGLINNDAHLDMFVGNDGGNTVFFGDGTGSFTDSGQSIGNGRTQNVHLFDADEDGDLDVFETNGGFGSQLNKIWLNNGAGVFTDSGLNMGISSASAGSDMGDLDGDDLLDVLVSNQNGDLRAWLNKTVIVRQQEITPSPAAQNASIGAPVAIAVTYSTSDADESLSGLGLRLHWNSSELTFVNLSSVFSSDLVSNDNSCQADGSDFDSDPDTDCFVEAVWADGGNDFPGAGNTPTALYTANFTANVPFAQTTFVKFSASDLAASYTLNANAATVTNPDSGEPEFDPTPAPGSNLLFGSVSTIGVSDPQIITVTNSGTGPLTLDCSLAGTNPNDFSVDVCPTPIAAGASTQVKILCEPLTVNLRIATLNIATNDSDESLVNYSLSCTGVAFAEFNSTPAPGISLDFGSVDVGATSSPLPITVRNLGRLNMNINCSLSGTDAGQFEIASCPVVVGQIDPVDVEVSCKPTGVGAISASLDMVTNDPDEGNVSWPLNCEGQTPDAETVFGDGFETPE